MHGEAPEVRGFDDADKEKCWIADRIGQLVDSGIATKDIAVVARTKRIRDRVGEAVQARGIAVLALEYQQSDNRELQGVRLATMHRVKGLEFRYVFIAGVNDGVIPLAAAIGSTEDPVETRDSDLNERALLHVSATRAIQRLFVSYSGAGSPYIVATRDRVADR